MAVSTSPRMSAVEFEDSVDQEWRWGGTVSSGGEEGMFAGVLYSCARYVFITLGGGGGAAFYRMSSPTPQLFAFLAIRKNDRHSIRSRNVNLLGGNCER